MRRVLPRKEASFATVNEHARREAEAEPEIARQVRQARGKAADGGVHKVKRPGPHSRVQEAAAAHDVEHVAPRRWMRASALPAFKAPPGYYLEWVRRDNSQRGDCQNLIAHLQEGWEIARKSHFPGKHVPTQRLSDYGDCIGNASSILMLLPLELKHQRDEYYRNQRNRATQAVGQRNPAPEGVSHPAMPIVEDENKVRTAMRSQRARRPEIRDAADA